MLVTSRHQHYTTSMNDSNPMWVRLLRQAAYAARAN